MVANARPVHCFEPFVPCLTVMRFFFGACSLQARAFLGLSLVLFLERVEDRAPWMNFTFSFLCWGLCGLFYLLSSLGLFLFFSGLFLIFFGGGGEKSVVLNRLISFFLIFFIFIFLLI